MDLNGLKELFGNDEIQTYQARMVRTLRDTTDPNLKQITMGVVGISKDPHEPINDWERLDCDIIIIPRQAYKSNDGMNNMRLDQAIQTLGNDERWTTK